MLGDAVIPNNHSALLPLHAGMEVSAPSNVFVEELEQSIGLFLLEANDLARD